MFDLWGFSILSLEQTYISKEIEMTEREIWSLVFVSLMLIKAYYIYKAPTKKDGE